MLFVYMLNTKKQKQGYYLYFYSHRILKYKYNIFMKISIIMSQLKVQLIIGFLSILTH